MSLKSVFYETGTELTAAYERVMESGQYIRGEEVKKFEDEFARFCGARYCVGVGNGLDAMTLCLRAWGIGRDSEVIVPSNTYIATWLAVSHCGAVPIPVEPDPETYTIDPNRIEDAITHRTKAIIPVHLYGRPAEMVAIREIARRRSLWVLEDAAQAAGATEPVSGTRVGSLGNAGAFSFYPTKNLGCFGDGGAVVTDDELVASRIRMLANYGSREKYHNEIRGWNSRLDELQAAFLRVLLPRLDLWNERRRGIAEHYREALDGVVKVPPRGGVWHQFVIRSSRRDHIKATLGRYGIETLIHYPIPPNRSPAYPGYGPEPIAERLASEVLSLPIGPHLHRAGVEEVINRVKEAIE
jgi:dTDP-4-amino-4,6-dideoxygalactose transaminase